jgi:hypothetical protein
MHNVTVLIGDISNSKKIAPHERASLQKTLDKAFSKMNRVLNSHFLSPLMLTIGDEFQAVCTTPESAWEVVLQLNSLAHTLDIQMRFAISHGKLLTAINREAPLKMDGPVFWKARELIEQKDRQFNFHIEGDPLNSTFRVLGFTLEETQNMWTSIQAKYVFYLLENPDQNPTEAARFFEKTPSTLHRMLKTTHIDLYREVKTELRLLLRGFTKRCHS